MSRLLAPAATGDVADAVVALLNAPDRPAPADLLGGVEGAGPTAPVPLGLSGLGTSAARVGPPSAATADGGSIEDLTAAVAAEAPPTEDDTSGRAELFCPPAVRDDAALG